MAYDYPYELVKIAQNSVSAASSTSFTSGISSNFTNYLVTVRHFLLSAVDAQVLLTMSTNGGSTYLSTNYSWVESYVNNGGIFVGSSNSASSINVSDTATTTSGRNSCIDLTLYNLASTTYVKTIYSFQGFWSADGDPAVEFNAGVQTSTSAINAIKFAPNTGTFTGVFTLYGIVDL